MSTCASSHGMPGAIALVASSSCVKASAARAARFLSFAARSAALPTSSSNTSRLWQNTQHTLH